MVGKSALLNSAYNPFAGGASPLAAFVPARCTLFWQPEH